MSTRRICFTKNNYSDNDIEALLKEPKFSYIVFGREIGDSGTPHLQGYAEFHKKSKFAPIAKKYAMACFVSKGTPDEAITYCKKDGDWLEEGTPKVDPKVGGAMESKRWDEAREAAKEGNFDAIPSDIYLRCYSTLHKVHQDAMPKPLSLDTLENEWIYGATGVGKSRSVVDLYGEANIYRKPRNKWWDGYKDESIVLIDEVSLGDDWIIPFLKTWADHYPFIAEMKGRSIAIRPKTIIVTSNYSIDDVCKGEDRDIEPLKRRFKVVHMLGMIGVNLPK